MNRSSPSHRHGLPERELLALPRVSIPRHRPENLRNIANEFKITRRRKFYETAYVLAIEYHLDKIIEEDLNASTEAEHVFTRAINNGVKLGKDVELIFGSRAIFSWWNELYFTCEGDLEEIALSFERDEFPVQLRDFIVLTVHALSKLPTSGSGRKRNLALRKWTAGHLDFWTNDLRRDVTLIHDRKDGYSPCHGWLHALLAEIDPNSLGALRHILREQKAELREESASK